MPPTTSTSAPGRSRSGGTAARDTFAGLAFTDCAPPRDPVGHGLVTERKSAGEEARHGHGQVEIASSHRKRTDEGARGAWHHGIRSVLPFDSTRLDVCQLAH